MSTSNNPNQQTLADSGANERPLMLEKGNYSMGKPMIPDPDGVVNINGTVKQILETLSKMTERNKKQYIADVKVMNYLFQAIPNDIYNSMDASKEGESLESVYERLTTLVNIMDHNNVCPIQCQSTPSFSIVYNPNVANMSPCHNARDSQKPRVRDANYFREQMLLAMKDEAGSTLNNEENDFMLDTSYGEETMEELTVVGMLMAQIQPADGNAETVPSYDAKAVSEVNASSKLAKKAIKERENRYLEDISNLEEKLTGLGYKNPKRLKKAIAAQPKMYDGEKLHSVNLKIDSPNSEETLEDAEESRLKMRNKMIQINYGKLNALYETFVTQQYFSMEQTYFSIPSASTNGSESKAITSDLPIPKMPKETTQTQHKKELDELIEHVNQKTYAYADVDVRAQNQDLLITISELKNKLKTINKGKNVNTNVESSNSVRRQKSKDTKSKNRVLKNTNAKSSTAHVRKMSRSVSIDSNKCETMNSTLFHANKSVLNIKNVTAVNDGSNIVCVSYGKDVFLLSHEKCVACYALSRNSNVKRALFTTPVAAKSKNLGATSVVAKSRLSVANTPKATNKVIRLVLWIVDSGCSKHMTGNLQLLRNFVEKFIGTTCFENDHFAAITGYGDYVLGNLMICHVYYVEEGDDLFIGSRDSNIYNIFIFKMEASSPVCLMSRATSTKSWLWHRRLSHLNFACEQGKSKKASLPPKLVPSIESKLELLHMDLCGPIRVVNEAPDMIIDFVNQVQKNLKAQIPMIRTDNGIEFKNKKLRAFYAKLGIVHQTSIDRTPQLNSVVECQNYTLVKAARTMLIFSKVPEFLWNEVMATACFTQNRSIVHTRYNKTPYALFRGRKPNIQYFYVFGSLCYPTNDRDDLGKMKSKADIDNSAANTLDNEHTSSSSSIVVEEYEAPQIVSSSAEQVATEPNSPVLNENADEFVQEDVADFDGNVFYNALPTPVFEEAESSSTYQDPSNTHKFHQKHRSSDRWTKNYPIEQVIGDPSKPVMTRNRLQTDAEVCMYALTMSIIEPKNIKESMLDASWIESMQDELN
ncbi:retrovirus-related pol polyprotein from transposon TNT 1-94 [Tanacetum coccineum]